MRVQVLVRCASDTEGRAEQVLALVNASMDVYAGASRLTSQGWSLGPVRIGPDAWPWRPRFDAQWTHALMRPARSGWARIEELAGLLKPPTAAARLPVSETQMPTYERGKDLLPQGWYQGPDGRERLLATREDDTLFEVQSGKAGWGKTMRAQVHAVASAHNGRGLAFVDPHGDSFAEVARYLAHDDIVGRTALFDLTVRGDDELLACWNLLDMAGGQRPYDVAAAVVDAFSTALGWDDVAAPRALTILTKAVEALVAVNTAAVAAGKPEGQATIFQIRPLLTAPSFRHLVLRSLDDEARRWWTSSFPDLPKDGLLTVLNPLERLGASPVTRAFLGCPVSGYDIRRAMDESHVVWICPPGTGPTDRMLITLIVRDFLRAGLSRRDLPAAQRRPFRFYLDELISLDTGASTVIAEITEQLRKFGCRLHGMTQLLHRLAPATRAALLQNASCLSTTAGSTEAITQITSQWPAATITADDVAALDRWQHYASFTVAGTRVGPLHIRGPELDEVFGTLARPTRTGALQRAALHNAGARPLSELTALALAQEQTVSTFLTGLTPPPPTTARRRSHDQPRHHPARHQRHLRPPGPRPDRPAPPAGHHPAPPDAHAPHPTPQSPQSPQPPARRRPDHPHRPRRPQRPPSPLPDPRRNPGRQRLARTPRPPRQPHHLTHRSRPARRPHPHRHPRPPRLPHRRTQPGRRVPAAGLDARGHPPPPRHRRRRPPHRRRRLPLHRRPPPPHPLPGLRGNRPHDHEQRTPRPQAHHLRPVPRLHPQPAGRRQTVADQAATLAWQRFYPRFPRVLFILTGASRTTLTNRIADLRRMTADHDLVTRFAARVPLGAAVLEDLEAHGPSAAVWTPLAGAAEPRGWTEL